MEAPLSASVQDSGEEPVSSLPGGALDVAVDQKSIEDHTGAGSSSEELLTQKLEDLSRQEVRPQEPKQEEMVFEKEGTCSGLDRDAPKEAEQNEAENQTQKGKIYTETGSTSVRADDEARKRNEPELGEAVQKTEGGADIVVRSEKERKGEDASTSRESDKEEIKARIGLNAEQNDLAVEGSTQSKVDASYGEKQKEMESSLKNLEKGGEGKKEKFEKTVDNISGQPGGEKKVEKKDKKDKKSRSSSERIQKKLEKINAKIGRILAKKEEYEVRLKEAHERERQESEKAAAHEPEVSTAVVGKPASDHNDRGLTSERTAEGNELRPDHDASTKESNKSLGKGSSGPLSLPRTASLIEVTTKELMEEVALQKRVAEKLANVLESDGSEMNPPLPTKDSDLEMKGQEKVLKHALHVDDSNDTGTL